VTDRHADFADLALSERVIAVVSGLRRQVEGDRQSGLALAQIGAIERIRGCGGGMSGIGAENPRLVAHPFGAHGFLAAGAAGRQIFCIFIALHRSRRRLQTLSAAAV
jgi:hypothetical protein